MKKITQQMARDLAHLGEEVVKETVRQPVEMAKRVGEQLGVMPRDWGEKKPSMAPSLVRKKEEKRRKDLVLTRRRMRELISPPHSVEPEMTEEEMTKRKALAEEAEKKKPLAEPITKKPRGLLLGVRRRKESSQPETGVGRRIAG
ncbi:MAG: hypothetical protein MUP45_01870 [Candidatus Marinimicrobia bacterium]|nr:hypothetical protein [Candidatus Neomarinimicrobiota bacterium]